MLVRIRLKGGVPSFDAVRIRDGDDRSRRSIDLVVDQKVVGNQPLERLRQQVRQLRRIVKLEKPANAGEKLLTPLGHDATSNASAAAWVRLRTPSFSYTASRCFLTVRSVISNRAPMAAFRCPAATRVKTSASRRLRPS